MKYWWCLLLISCTPWVKDPDIVSVPDLANVKGREVIVFIHGYYGSALREPYGDRQFLRVLPILYGNFSVGMFPDLLGLSAPKLEVEGMISHFPVAPFYSIDVYGQGIKAIQNEDQLVVPFAYDWRQDLAVSAAELTEFLQKLETYEPKKIHLFAHSMGGMVAVYSYLYGKQDPLGAVNNPKKQEWRLVKSITTLGTPFQGAMSIFRNMQVGTGYPWNPALLQAETVASFPASYYLLPLHRAEFFSENEKKLLPLSELDFWREQKVGLLRNQSHPKFAERLEFTKNQLERAFAFQTLLQTSRQLPLFQLIGKGTPTLTYGEYQAPTQFAFREKDAKDFSRLRGDGDGTVPVDSAHLPNEMVEKIHYTQYPHDKVFLDPDFLANFTKWKETK